MNSTYHLLNALDQAERELPHLLEEDGWESLDIDYHPPRVQRLWRSFGDYRLNLHRLLPCASSEALVHPHPWPSIVKIYSGGYWSSIGRSETRLPPEHHTYHDMYFGQGSIIVDDDNCSWHSVAPDKTTYSLMITGSPWTMDHWAPDVIKKPEAKLKQLEPHEVALIKEAFAGFVL